MQIAVTSQNRKTVTEHAGKCRKFWIYDIKAGRVVSRQLVELGIEHSFHARVNAISFISSSAATKIWAGRR